MDASRAQRVATYTILTVCAVVLCAPVYYMTITAFKGSKELAESSVSFVLKEPTLGPARDLFRGSQYGRAAFNSLLIAALTSLGNIFLCPLAGFAFAKHSFPGRDKIFLILLATMMIPGTVLLVPGFLLARDLGWLNTWLPLVVPALAGVFGVFLSRQFISRIPDSILAAARVDGCSEWRIFLHVILPLCKPLLATLGILSFLASWNNFVGPLVMLLDESKFTLPLVIALLQGRFQGRANIQMAGALLSIVPVLAVFFILQTHIVKSLASTGLKE